MGDDTDVSDIEEQVQKASEVDSKWGEIVALDSKRFMTFECRESSIKIGRNAQQSNLVIDDKRLSGVHCELVFDKESQKMFLNDLSTNGTFVFDQKVGKNNKREIEFGDIVYLLHKSKVDASEVLGFVVKLTTESVKGRAMTATQEAASAAAAVASTLAQVNAASEAMEEKARLSQVSHDLKIQQMQQQHDEEKKQIQEQLKKLKTQDDKMGEELECVICMDLIYSCVTLQPCLHNLCGACFYDWKQKSNECPNCRSNFIDFSKNATLNNLVEAFINKHPDKKNSKEYYEEHDVKVKLLWNIAPQAGANKKVQGNNEMKPSIVAVAPSSASAVVQGAPKVNGAGSMSSKAIGGKRTQRAVCKECTKARDEDDYQCDDSTKHVRCNACTKEFADRGDECDNQKCLICELFFCNLYGTCKTKRQLENGNYLQVIRDVKPPAYLPIGFFRGNEQEGKIMSQYMTTKRLSTKNIFDEMLNSELKAGKFFFEKSAQWIKGETANKQIQLRETSAVCENCFTNLLWFQIIVKYRIKIVKELPSPYNTRDKCWYGINCKTQVREDHAKKLDHVCAQTKQ